MSEYQKVLEASKDLADHQIDIAIIAGTGLSHLGEQVADKVVVDYEEVPHFGKAKVKGHAGKIVFGTLENKKVGVLNGRYHLYEGWSAKEVVRPLRVLNQLGAKTLIVTNCAGSLNPKFQTPAAMLILDQINLTAKDPLTGPQEDEMGERFVDMSNCYDPKLIELVRNHKDKMTLPLHEGIYVGLHGPMFESSAERRMLHQLGADAVGMSTVLEVISARHAKMNVLGFSALANMAIGGENQQEDSHDAILKATYPIAKEIGHLIVEILPLI